MLSGPNSPGDEPTTKRDAQLSQDAGNCVFVVDKAENHETNYPFQTNVVLTTQMTP